MLIPGGKDKSPDELWFGKRQEIRDLKQWGRLAYAASRTKIKKKISPKSKQVLFIGYPLDHPKDTFRF